MRYPVAVLMALSAMGSPAQAEQPASIAVMPVRGSERPADVSMLWHVRQAVDRHPALRSADIVGALGPGASIETDPELGREALAEGKRAFDELELEGAITHLREAARNLTGAGDAGERAQALALLAQCQVALKDVEAAAETFGELLKIQPDFQPAAGTPPSVRRALRRAKRLDRRGGAFRLESSPVPAAIFLDGRFVGVTPALLEDVAAGSHTLRLDADGYLRIQRDVRVRPGRGLALRLELERAPKARILDELGRRIAQEVGADSMRDALADLKALVFAQQVILVEMADDALRGHLYDLRSGRRVRTVQVPLDDQQEAAGRLLEALYQGLDPRAPGLTAEMIGLKDETPMAPAPPIYRRWWFWPAVAATTAAAIAVPLLAISDEAPQGLREQDGKGALFVRF